MNWEYVENAEIEVTREPLMSFADFLDVEKRQAILRRLPYDEFLESEYWQMTRRQVLGRRRWCERCGGRDALQVHHRTYERLGAELDEDFEVLCRRCHATEHGKPYDEVPARPRGWSSWSSVEMDTYPTYSADYE